MEHREGYESPGLILFACFCPDRIRAGSQHSGGNCRISYAFPDTPGSGALLKADTGLNHDVSSDGNMVCKGRHADKLGTERGSSSIS